MYTFVFSPGLIMSLHLPTCWLMILSLSPLMKSSSYKPEICLMHLVSLRASYWMPVSSTIHLKFYFFQFHGIHLLSGGFIKIMISIYLLGSFLKGIFVKAYTIKSQCCGFWKHKRRNGNIWHFLISSESELSGSGWAIKWKDIKPTENKDLMRRIQ